MSQYSSLIVNAIPFICLVCLFAILFVDRKNRKEAAESGNPLPPDRSTEGLCLGMSLGVLVGIFIGNSILFMNIGMLLGTLIGMRIEGKPREEDQDDRNDQDKS